MNERGVTDKIISEAKLGYGRFYNQNWITIPIRAGGKFAFFKLRQDPQEGNKKMSFPKGISAQIYDWKSLNTASGRLVICEGELDKLLLQGQGISAVTSTHGAGTFKKEWFSPCNRYLKYYVCFDNDEAGKKGAERAVQKLLDADCQKVYKVDLPKEVGKGGDITDYFKKLKKTKKDFLELLSKAKRISEVFEEKEDKEGEKGRPRLADKLFLFALANGVSLLLDQTSEPHIILPEKPTVAFPVKSSVFRRWLSAKYWEAEQRGFGGETFLGVVASLEGLTFHQGDTRTLFNRVAKDGNTIFYDLGDDMRVVKVSESDWKITSECPILFRRFNHQKPQVDPIKGGKLSEVLKFINLKTETDKLLFLTYLVAVLIPDIPRVVIINVGDQGAAKSSALRVARSLVDPSLSELLSPPRDIIELAQNANHHYCLYLDNLSSLPDWLSDVLCRLTTGIGFSKRKLYTDDEDILFNQKVAIGMTGINLVAEKPDLLDRSLILRFDAITENERIVEGDFWHEFNQKKPFILGALFSTLSKTIKIANRLSLSRKPRMADYAKYAAAAAVAMEKTAEQFLSAFEANVNRQNQAAIESSPTAQVILQFMEDKADWNGPSSELHKLLLELAEQANLKVGGVGGFPKSSNWLWKRIKQVRQNLLALGVRATHDEDNTSSLIELMSLSKGNKNIATVATTSTLTPKSLGDISKDDQSTSTNVPTHAESQLGIVVEPKKEVMAVMAASSDVLGRKLLSSKSGAREAKPKSGDH